MSAKADIWMPVYIGDYLADTTHLTAEQHGAYLLLLFTYWKRRKPLPNDSVFLANAARLTADAWSIHQAVLEEFFDTSSGNAWVHHRVEDELAKAGEKKQKAAEKAKKAADARWNNAPGNAPGNAPSITQALHEECPSPSPSPSNKKKEKDIGSTFVAPPWVDQQLWNDFLEMRKKIKKPATDRAKQLLVTELLKLVQMGYTQEEIIGNSIKNCWQDFYAPKNSGGSRGFVC